MHLGRPVLQVTLLEQFCQLLFAEQICQLDVTCDRWGDFFRNDERAQNKENVRGRRNLGKMQSDQQMFLFCLELFVFPNVSTFSFCALSLSVKLKAFCFAVFLFKVFCENDAILSSFFGNIIRFHVNVCICMCLNACTCIHGWAGWCFLRSVIELYESLHCW